MSDLTIKVHLVTGEALEFAITFERALETIQENRTSLEFDGWKPEAFESKDRALVRRILLHLYGEALRIGPGKGLDRRKPEDPGWHVPQGMFYLSKSDSVTAIPARNVVAISVIDPDERGGSRFVGFAAREGDVTG